MSSARFERIGFGLSFVFLAFIYGFAAHAFGWFPSRILTRAGYQAYRLISPPSFVARRTYERQGTRILDVRAHRSGATLIAQRWRDSDWKPGLELIDSDGTVLHRWRFDPKETFSDSALKRAVRDEWKVDERPLHGAQVLSDGDVLVNLDYVGTLRLDACGRVKWGLPSGSHHSIERASDGTFWIPGVSSDVRRSSPAHPDGFPGLDNPVYHDRILRVTGDGQVLQKINVLDLLYTNGLEHHIVKKGRLSGTDDVTHLNDVEPLPAEMAAEYPLFEAGDLVVSLRELDLVLVFDPYTEVVKWHSSHPFIKQHDPDFIGDGWIGVFDNRPDGTARGTVLGGSRIVAIQPHTDSTTVLFPTARSEPFYTEIMGNWQALDNGNLLLTESQAGRIVEVDTDGRTVWDWVGAPYERDRWSAWDWVWEWVGAPHEKGMVVEVTDGTRYDLTAEEVAAWPCSLGEGSESGDGDQR